MLQVKLTSDSSNSTTENFIVGLNQTSVTITNLVQRTDYTAEVNKITILKNVMCVD